MSTGLVDVFNLALSACGSQASISDPDEQSREAALCRLWYPQTRDTIQASAPWPSVRRFARLARLKERTDLWLANDPAPEFRFSYSVPSNMLHPYRMHSYERFDLSSVSTGRIISSNEEQPILLYNARQDDPALWEAGLRTAMIYGLAVNLAIPLTGRNSRLMENFQMASEQIEAAQINAANSSQTQVEPLPDWLQARGFAFAGASRFVYPFMTFSVPK
jgi:hypothetical protein